MSSGNHHSLAPENHSSPRNHSEHRERLKKDLCTTIQTRLRDSFLTDQLGHWSKKMKLEGGERREGTQLSSTNVSIDLAASQEDSVTRGQDDNEKPSFIEDFKIDGPYALEKDNNPLLPEDDIQFRVEEKRFDFDAGFYRVHFHHKNYPDLIIGKPDNQIVDVSDTIPEYFDEGYVQHSLNLLQIAARSEDPMSLFHLGRIYFLSQKYGKAYRLFRQCANYDLVDCFPYLGRCYLEGLSVAKDEELAFECFLEAAKNGSTEGTYWLGICYKDGLGVKQDPIAAFNMFKKGMYADHLPSIYQLGKSNYYSNEKAIELLLRCGNAGHIPSLYLLGNSYLTGTRVEPNPEKAFHYLLQAARGNHKLAYYRVAVCYCDGIGVNKNYTKAITWLQKGAEQKHPDSLYLLGVLTLLGRGCAINEKEAFCLFTKAVSLGSVQSFSFLGLCYFNGLGTKKDIPTARLQFFNGAKKGDIQSIYYLGRCYLAGYGIEKNPVEALSLFKKAHLSDHIEASYWLACCHFEGWGIEKDFQKAYEYFLLPAQANNPDALYFLGLYYFNGLLEPANYQKAFDRFLAAAHLGHPPSLCWVGKCFAEGYGTPVDLVSASNYFLRAASKGSQEALKSFEGLMKTDSPVVIAFNGQFYEIPSTFKSYSELHLQISQLLSLKDFDLSTQKYCLVIDKDVDIIELKLVLKDDILNVHRQTVVWVKYSDELLIDISTNDCIFMEDIITKIKKHPKVNLPDNLELALTAYNGYELEPLDRIRDPNIQGILELSSLEFPTLAAKLKPAPTTSPPQEDTRVDF